MRFFKTIREDIRAVKDRDPAAQGAGIIFFTYPGLHARWLHIPEHFLWTHGWRRLARVLSQLTRFFTGVEIHPGAVIGRRFFIDHAMGVIIGETTIIGDDCTLYQGVTLGGTGKECGKRHPTLGNNVMVGVGASVLGDIYLGDNCKVGGGAVVVRDVPENCTVVGIPGQIVVRDGRRVAAEKSDELLRHESLPDPSQERFACQVRELEYLIERVCELEKQVEALSAERDSASLERNGIHAEDL